VVKSPQALQNAINTLLFLYRGATRKSLTAQEFAQVLSSKTKLAEGTWKFVARMYMVHRQQLLDAAEETKALKISTLKSFDWKLGVAVKSSDASASSEAPFVSVILSVAQPGGELTKHHIELNIPQFQEFAKQLQNMYGALETL